MKLVWLSDPHFTAEGDVLGYDPRARLQGAIDHVCAHHADAQACVVSGDLVDKITSEDYRALGTFLAQLPMPVFPMMGNHDDRTLLRAHLPLPDDALPDFVQYAIETPTAKLLCLDTHKSGSAAGAFCSKRTAWLRQELETAGDKPTILFLHHPPLALGLPMQDDIRMENGDAFLSLVSSFDCVKYMCMGHVHRPVSGATNGLPFATLPSLTFQAPASQPAWDWNSFVPADEPPSFGILNIDTTGAVTLQQEQFCAASFGKTQPKG